MAMPEHNTANRSALFTENNERISPPGFTAPVQTSGDPNRTTTPYDADRGQIVRPFPSGQSFLASLTPTGSSAFLSSRKDMASNQLFLVALKWLSDPSPPRPCRHRCHSRRPLPPLVLLLFAV